LTFLGHVTSSVTWTIDPPYVISYQCLIVTEPLSLTAYEIFVSKYIWVTTLTFLGHVTSSVTWPFDSPGTISYRCSVVTESLSPTIFEIMGIFYIWVTWRHRSRHVSNRSTICHFLLVSHCNRTSIYSRFRDIRPQYPCAHADRIETQTHTRRHVDWQYAWSLKAWRARAKSYNTIFVMFVQVIQYAVYCFITFETFEGYSMSRIAPN